MGFINDDTHFTLPTGHFLLLSNIKYDEEKLVEHVKENKDTNELLIAALQMSVHGFGRGEYGKVQIENVEKEITKIFDENNVIYNNRPGLKLEDTEVTPKRLLRIFRYQISTYFLENPEIESFLFRKYATSGSSYYIFPGSEYLVDNKEHASELLETYHNMDARLNTHFVEKIKSILDAREIEYEE
jgi:hypothetical protein